MPNEIIEVSRCSQCPMGKTRGHCEYHDAYVGDVVDFPECCPLSKGDLIIRLKKD